MKKLFLSLLLFVSFNTEASIIVQDFSILPSNNVNTATDVYAAYEVLTTNNSFLSSPTEVNTFGTNVTIDVYISEGLLPVISYLSETLLIGQLPEATYDITANFYDTTSGVAVLNTSLTEHLTVSPIPIPSALALFLSGLLIFITKGVRKA